MRSSKEIAFRLKQECANFLLMVRPPVLPSGKYAIAPVLPDVDDVVERLRGTDFARSLKQIADSILADRIPLLGLGEVNVGVNIDWSRDYIHNRTSGIEYFRKIPYLDFEAAGDHKIVWELNRHQHLVVLAQCFRLTQERVYFDKLKSQLRHWMISNPFQRGINWASALEVGFRALSWLWIYHLAGDSMEDEFRREFLTVLYRHGLHLEYNLSHFFSPNTHLLGEAVALHAIGRLLPGFPRAEKWRKQGATVVDGELRRQILADGGHFEKSTYYHVYAADMILFHALLAGRPPTYGMALSRIATYLAAVLGPARQLPFIGDDDGGRMFHPFGRRDRFGRATLASCAVYLNREDLPYDEYDLNEQAVWWIGPAAIARPSQWGAPLQSQIFRDTGIAALAAGDVHMLFDFGGYGPGSSAHSHADTLSVTLTKGEEEILIDPATYTYISDITVRNWFRGTSAHNTVRVDRIEQGGLSKQPFKWTSKPEAELLAWQSGPKRDYIDAQCRYGGIVHRRRLFWLKPAWIAILDEVTGPPGHHHIEQFWHTSAPVRDGGNFSHIGSCALLTSEPSGVTCEFHGGNARRSRAFGQFEDAPVIIVRLQRHLPVLAATVFDLSGDGGQLSIEGMCVSVIRDGHTVFRADFAEVPGMPLHSSV
jgi:hypothetical protein